MIQPHRVASVLEGNARGPEAEDPIPCLNGCLMLGGIIEQRKVHRVGKQGQHQVLFAGEGLRRVEQRVVAMMQRWLGAALGGLFRSHDAPLHRSDWALLASYGTTITLIRRQSQGKTQRRHRDAAFKTY